MASNKKLGQRTSLDTDSQASAVRKTFNEARTKLPFAFLTSRTFCMVSGVMLKLTGVGITLAFCGWRLKGYHQVRIHLRLQTCLFTYFTHLTMHNELTVLTQIFGQQGALQITAEGVLRRKQGRHNTD